jgi:hypothetical protein
MIEHDLRLAESATVAHGTLACPRCDAPLALAGPAAAGDPIECPFCAHGGTLGGFVSLAVPTRPARVVVRTFLPPATENQHG